MIARVFDEHGTVTISGQKTTRGARSYTLRISVTLRDLEMIKSFLVHGGSVSQQKDKYSQLYRWTIASRKAAAFLQTVLPYLERHKNIATLAISFQQSLQEHRKCNNGRRVIDDSTLATRHALMLQMRSMQT